MDKQSLRIFAPEPDRVAKEKEVNVRGRDSWLLSAWVRLWPPPAP